MTTCWSDFQVRVQGGNGVGRWWEIGGGLCDPNFEKLAFKGGGEAIACRDSLGCAYSG